MSSQEKSSQDRFIQDMSSYERLRSPDRLGKIKSGQVKSGLVKSGQLKSGYVVSAQLKLRQIISVQVKPGKVKSGHVITNFVVITITHAHRPAL